MCRCIHLLSMSGRHYGCINGAGNWSTPGFQALGIPQIMSLRKGSSRLRGTTKNVFKMSKVTIQCMYIMPNSYIYYS